MTDDRKLIAIYSIPRAGQVWLTRLLADTLNCPVTTWLPQDEGKDIAVEGTDRPGTYRVTRGHSYRPAEQEAPFQIIHLIRDPRDVVVSTGRFRYPEYADNRSVQMAAAANEVLGSWNNYARQAMEKDDLGTGARVATMTYEGLMGHAEAAVRHLVGGSATPERIREAIERQSFANRKAQIAAHQPEDDASAEFLDRTDRRHIGHAVVGGWRDALPGNLHEVIMEGCAPDLLQFFGYTA